MEIDVQKKFDLCKISLERVPCFSFQVIFNLIDVDGLQYIEKNSIKAFLKSQGIGKYHDKESTSKYIFDRLNKYNHPSRVTYACFAEVMTPHASDLAA